MTKQIYSFFLFAAAITSTISVKAQTADEIVQKHINAIGGAENWRKITSIRITGTLSADSQQIPMVITTLAGKGQRIEFTVDGKTGIEVVTPTNGWAYNPETRKTDIMPADVLKESQDQLDIAGPLLDYKTKGIKVAYIGKEKVDKLDCFKLKVTYPGGKEETMFINSANYYHIITTEKIKVQGKDEEDFSDYYDHKKLPEGIVYPMAEENASGLIEYKKIEINVPVDESLFKQPSAKAK